MTTEYGVYRFHDGERYVCVLARSGRTKLHITHIDEPGVVHRAVPLAEARSLTPLPYRAGAYPVELCVKALRRVGRERGITEAAKEELKRASA